MKYKPFTTDSTEEIIKEIKHSLPNIEKDQITIDTLDICHLLGEIERLQENIGNYVNIVLHDRKEIDRLNNIINKIDKMLGADTHCENIYYAIGVLLNKSFFDIKMVDNEELLNILGSDKNE